MNWRNLSNPRRTHSISSRWKNGILERKWHHRERNWKRKSVRSHRTKMHWRFVHACFLHPGISVIEGCRETAKFLCLYTVQICFQWENWVTNIVFFIVTRRGIWYYPMPWFGFRDHVKIPKIPYTKTFRIGLNLFPSPTRKSDCIKNFRKSKFVLENAISSPASSRLHGRFLCTEVSKLLTSSRTHCNIEYIVPRCPRSEMPRGSSGSSGPAGCSKDGEHGQSAEG